MNAVCTRCGTIFETTTEDANDPGDDFKGPECPACYRRRRGLPEPATIRRRHPHAVECRSCHALVVWFRTSAGKKMPVDEETTQPTDAEHQLDLKRHRSHFATCPNANQHRRAR